MRRCVILALLMAGLSPSLGVELFGQSTRKLNQPIVNGVLTTELSSVAYLAIAGADGVGSCTGTLIGCRTVLTAAHCFCPEVSGDLCNPNETSLSAVFLQHGGVFGVSDVQIHPDWQPITVEHDLAVVRLSSQLNGVAPTRINTLGRVADGVSGLIAGFGRTQGSSTDSGLKRAGLITTTSCAPGNPANHICWRFESPIGPPGEDSSTCFGDSGGPLFFEDTVGNLIVSGVTSFGTNSSCLAPIQIADADVFVDRGWIQSAGGADLSNSICGDLPQAGTADAPISFGEGQLTTSVPQELWNFDVPAGTARLRVSLNAENPLGPPLGSGNNFDLLVGRGSAPNASNVTCTMRDLSAIEFCDIPFPAQGNWFAQVERILGSGQYQLTITTFAGDDIGTGPCTPGPTTLCLLDNRFRVEVDWRTPEGTEGKGNAKRLTSDTGYFWFFDEDNVEMVIKVLNACSFADRFWVFAGGLTNVEVDIRVTDTERELTVPFGNPQGVPFQPIQDTNAFATCP